MSSRIPLGFALDEFGSPVRVVELQAGDALKLPGALNEAPIVTLASAATVNIGAAAANTINISGTTTITAFDAIASGAKRTLVFQGALTLTHNGTSLILPKGVNITTAAGSTAEFVSLGSGNWRCTNFEFASAASQRAELGVREQLTADRTYYVRTDGNDSNDGLVNTAGGAFLTLQKAADVIGALDISIYSVGLAVGAGTFESFVCRDPIGSGSVTVAGQGATTIINRTATSGAAISFVGECKKWRFNSVKYQAPNGTAHGVLVTHNQQTLLTNCVSGVCTGFHMNVAGGYLNILGTHTIEGNASIHWLCSYKGQIVAAANVTLVGSIAFAQAFAFCNMQSLIRMAAITFTGTATGVRFNVSTQSQINVNGAGLTYLPGSVAGVTDTSTGGLYL